MRLPRIRCAALLSWTLLACGAGRALPECQHNFDCGAGEACIASACAAVPCGGTCQPDEACANDGSCVNAQGVSCLTHSCPAAYPCNSGGSCARPCTLDGECGPGLVCNPALRSCARCSNNTQCAGQKDTPVCDDAGSGSCVACNGDFDCLKAQGSGHFCEAHGCKAGCKSTADCNAGLGETCDTAVAPGRCIQCKTASDCAGQGPAASACDDTGHCVQCAGPTQAAANAFCGAGTPECNLATGTCVACLPIHDASGKDCGYPYNGAMDPHDARTCSPATYTCQNGCQSDAQCGCPRTASGGAAESACARFPDQEHCDPTRTTMAGVAGATLGACVQCTANEHCAYKIQGTALYGGAHASLNGARCAVGSCVEGCDADADCWPDHATSNGKVCHLGAAGDPQNHKCVECRCDVPGADPSSCELNGDGSRACPNSPGGKPRVCDAGTLSCRLKRQGELCESNLECGAPAPGSTCFPLGTQGSVPDSGFCAISRNADVGNPTLYCSPGKGTPGRCADFYNGSCSCPPGSAHAAAASVNGSNQVCVPGSCNYQ